jgi:hypothetical protein
MGQLPIIGGAGARHGGFRCPLRVARSPLQGGQVPIIAGSGAHLRAGRCPLMGGQASIRGGSGAHHRSVLTVNESFPRFVSFSLLWSMNSTALTDSAGNIR